MKKRIVVGMFFGLVFGILRLAFNGELSGFALSAQQIAYVIGYTLPFVLMGCLVGWLWKPRKAKPS
jgi:hypothetical protein